MLRAIERSIEAYAIAEAGDELADFQAHEHSYDRAGEIDLFEGETAERLKVLYSDNRIESYYGGSPHRATIDGHGRPRHRRPRVRCEPNSGGRHLSLCGIVYCPSEVLIISLRGRSDSPWFLGRATTETYQML